MAIGYYNFPVTAFLQSSQNYNTRRYTSGHPLLCYTTHPPTATMATHSKTHSTHPPSIKCHPLNFCSREQNNFQCSLNCGGNERSLRILRIQMPTAGLWNLQCYSTTILWDYDYGPETGSWLRFALGQKKKRKKGGSRKEKKNRGGGGRTSTFGNMCSI